MIEQLSFAFAELTIAPTQIVDFYPNFLSQSEGDELFAASQDLQWQQNEIRIFGKPIANPRLEAIYGDEGCNYSYSGILLSVSPWVDCLRELRDRTNSSDFMLRQRVKTLKALCSYYGGKTRIASKIVNYINEIPHTVYVEPFCGGAAVLFAKPRREVTNGNHYREVINDTSDILISLYRCAVECPEQLALKLEATLYSQSDHARAKVICKNPKDHTSLDIAWAYFVNVNCSFANKLNAGWGTQVINENSAATWHNRITSLKEKLDRLQSVHVSCEDALRCIDRWDSSHSLFYCDPPYPGTNQGHYEGYTTKDWIALCDKLDSIQGSYILSNYPQEYEPKSAQQRIEISTTMSASGKGKVRSDRSKVATQEQLGERKRTEVLWICNRGKSDRADIQSLLNFSRSSQLTIF